MRRASRGGSNGKESPCSTGDLGSIPGSGRSPGEGNGNPLQYSCLDNPVDKGAWGATVHEVTKTRTSSWGSQRVLSDQHSSYEEDSNGVKTATILTHILQKNKSNLSETRAICLLIFLNLIKKTNIFQTTTTQKQSRHNINIKIIKLGPWAQIQGERKRREGRGYTVSHRVNREEWGICAAFSSFLM